LEETHRARVSKVRAVVRERFSRRNTRRVCHERWHSVIAGDRPGLSALNRGPAISASNADGTSNADRRGMTNLRRSSLARLLTVVFPLVIVGGGLSLAACGGEVAPSPPESTNPQGDDPQPGGPQPGSSQPSGSQPTSPPTAPPPTAPQGSVLVGSFGHQSPSPNDYDGASVDATATGATFDFQCMHGETSALIVDATGAFTAQGSLTTTGGVIQSYPDAKFTGTVAGNTLTLTATWQTTITSKDGTMPYTETYGPQTFTKDLVPKRQAGCI
jgi:hypothetical protein